MDRLEEQLKRALQPEEPSTDFADRVMARIAQLPAAQRQEKERGSKGRLKWLAAFFEPLQMKWAMAGAMACLLLFAALGVQKYREQQRALEIAEGEKAREQVLLAMRIASSKLNVAQKKVHENSER